VSAFSSLIVSLSEGVSRNLTYGTGMTVASGRGLALVSSASIQGCRCTYLGMIGTETFTFSFDGRDRRFKGGRIFGSAKPQNPRNSASIPGLTLSALALIYRRRRRIDPEPSNEAGRERDPGTLDEEEL